MKMKFNELRDEYDDVATYCDIYNCDDCPRKGDDCDGKADDEEEDEIEADGFITRDEDLKPLERTSENTATPIKECIYPRCEECDKYHGRYCTVPMVISKQIYRLMQEKIGSMEQRLDWIEKAVTDEILGEREVTR